MADQYDPRQVAVFVDGQEIVGFAEGTMISVERSNPRWSADVGAKGEATAVRSADDTATATITLKHNSVSNQLLHQLWAEQDEPGRQISFSVTDRNFDGNVSVSGSDCKIVNLPTFTRGAEVESVEWEILIFDYNAAFEGVS
jgi:hypothetical protein